MQRARGGSVRAPEAAMALRAMGRSSNAPSLGMSAGARFTETCPFRVRPRVRSAARTRSFDSRTATSGIPTMEMRKSPPVISTSTSTGNASIPLSVTPKIPPMFCTPLVLSILHD